MIICNTWSLLVTMIGVGFINVFHLHDFLQFYNALSTKILWLMVLPVTTLINLFDETFSYRKEPNKDAAITFSGDLEMIKLRCGDIIVDILIFHMRTMISILDSIEGLLERSTLCLLSGFATDFDWNEVDLNDWRGENDVTLRFNNRRNHVEHSDSI